jgi:hypothetical protein
MHRGVRIAATAVAAIVVLGLIAAGALVYPWFRDDVVLDQIVIAVALDWRDFGKDTALARLQYELDHREVGLQVSDDHCALSMTPTGERVVRCLWEAPLPAAVKEAGLRLHFASEAFIDRAGELQWGAVPGP